ncbi:MAG TPA: CapA family protein [Actinomycetota bacterium]|jgi:poly-gamma-glutamate capsule biosynthesis protein CapA/YwtB (metallophosphatase superfamily)|nr:CapA family protein [Actinomycetota bacterium]
MTVTVALAGDTMLGRGVARALTTSPPQALVAPEVRAAMDQADLVVLNLECCISERGRPWDAPGKPFFFRAPPRAVELLVLLGVDCVTLANNHALDYGVDALLDTLVHLDAAGIAVVGAGADLEQARQPAVLGASGLRVAVVGVTDHPPDFSAGPDRPGVAFADLGRAVPDWLLQTVRAADADVLLVSPHWGPNMTTAPVRHVRRAATALVDAGATLVAGHSAHVPHGVAGRVLYDLGDFLDDYRVDPRLRNDLGLLFLVSLDAGGPVRLEALPLKLDFCHTRLAAGEDAAWMRHRFRAACATLGTTVEQATDRLIVSWR